MPPLLAQRCRITPRHDTTTELTKLVPTQPPPRGNEPRAGNTGYLVIRQYAEYTMAEKKQAEMVSDQLRVAILAAGENRHRIALATGVQESTLSRFVRGERGLDLTSVDKLAAYLGLELVPKGRNAKGRVKP